MASIISPYKRVLRDRATASQLFRHLLRALLREASYLPDPAARIYFRGYIIDRFRSYRSTRGRPKKVFAEEANAAVQEAKSPSQGTPWHVDAFLIRKNARDVSKLVQLFDRGKTELRRLARANLGHESPLMRVLMQAYGRSGPRKWEILRPLLQAEAPVDTDALKMVLRHENLSSLKKFETPPKLMALARAQSTAMGLPANYNKIKLDPNLERLTERLRPLPLSRKRKIYRKWFNEVCAKVMVPLPNEEAERLREIAQGKNMHGVRATRRRSPAQDLGKTYVPASEPSSISSSTVAELCNIMASTSLKIDDSHQLTTRYLSRCLKTIYRLTPTLNFAGEKWRASFPEPDAPKWKDYVKDDNKGLTRRAARRLKNSVAVPSDHWMFVDEFECIGLNQDSEHSSSDKHVAT